MAPGKIIASYVIRLHVRDGSPEEETLEEAFEDPPQLKTIASAVVEGVTRVLDPRAVVSATAERVDE